MTIQFCMLVLYGFKKGLLFSKQCWSSGYYVCLILKWLPFISMNLTANILSKMHLFLQVDRLKLAKF